MLLKLLWQWLCRFLRNLKAKKKQEKAAEEFLAKPNIISVYLGDRNRRLVNAELLQKNFYTLWVRLFDGHIIKRKKKRDLPVEGGGELCK